MTVFEAYITNVGKYAEGQLVGETLKFPATTEEVQSLLKNIGVDGVRYEEFFITAFDGDVMGLYDYWRSRGTSRGRVKKHRGAYQMGTHHRQEDPHLAGMLMCGKVTHKNLNRQQPIIPKKS